MENKKKKLIVLLIILTVMVGYIAWIFHKSEPKYINNVSQVVSLYDIVSINDQYGDQKLAMVLQIDSVSFTRPIALVKLFDTFNAEFATINTSTLKGETKSYIIVGTGTFYHKVNHFIGFNIMLITTIIIGILSAVLFTIVIGLLRDIMGFKCTLWY